jgi:serine/threonine protein kinase
MGTVYLAERTVPVWQQVAIKVITHGAVSLHARSRFAVERRELARMSHDCIAKVFDVGETDRGLPYFVMEYVDGLPFHRACDEERLTLRERIALLRKVCDGVGHAHQKGVVHRDLKPGNVLVIGDRASATPKIIDFGLARALEQAAGEPMLTEQGQILGTLEYMAPEQASGDLDRADTRTDVHALGVGDHEQLAASRHAVRLRRDPRAALTARRGQNRRGAPRL